LGTKKNIQVTITLTNKTKKENKTLVGTKNNRKAAWTLEGPTFLANLSFGRVTGHPKAGQGRI
jgi:hypothetical protein